MREERAAVAAGQRIRHEERDNGPGGVHGSVGRISATGREIEAGGTSSGNTRCSRLNRGVPPSGRHWTCHQQAKRGLFRAEIRERLELTVMKQIWWRHLQHGHLQSVSDERQMVFRWRPDQSITGGCDHYQGGRPGAGFHCGKGGQRGVARQGNAFVPEHALPVVFDHVCLCHTGQARRCGYRPVPDVSGYTWGDFHRGRELLKRGEAACLMKMDEIERGIRMKVQQGGITGKSPHPPLPRRLCPRHPRGWIFSCSLFSRSRVTWV